MNRSLLQSRLGHRVWRSRRRSGLTLLEVLVAAVIFAVGLTVLSTIFPYGTKAALNSEANSRAALLARSVFEGFRADPRGAGQLCFLIGDNIDNDNDGRIDEEVLDGQDTDGDGQVDEDPGFVNGIILPGNGRDDDAPSLGPNDPTPVPLRVDADGLPEDDVWFSQNNNFDDDYDDLIDDDGDYNMVAYAGAIAPFSTSTQEQPYGDGVLFYDPETLDAVRGLDEEVPDYTGSGANRVWIDNDGDGRYDEDLRMPSCRLPQSPGRNEYVYEVDAGAYPNLPPGAAIVRLFDPSRVGDGIDNDGDSGRADGGNNLPDDSTAYPAPRATQYPKSQDERENTKTDRLGVPVARRVVADGIDNDGDRIVDEGIDEELWNGIDDDGDGLIDEDVGMAHARILPPGDVERWLRQPRSLFAPVRWPRQGQRYLDTNGGAESRVGAMFEDKFFFQVAVAPLHDGAGNGIDDDDDAGRLGIGPADPNAQLYIDEEIRDGLDNDGDGRIDEDLGNSVIPNYLRVRVTVSWDGDEISNDNDPFIDEEAPDGKDNDFDGLIDEDVYAKSYTATGVIQVLLGEEPR